MHTLYLKKKTVGKISFYK